MGGLPRRLDDQIPFHGIEALPSADVFPPLSEGTGTLGQASWQILGDDDEVDIGRLTRGGAGDRPEEDHRDQPRPEQILPRGGGLA